MDKKYIIIRDNNDNISIKGSFGEYSLKCTSLKETINKEKGIRYDEKKRMCEEIKWELIEGKEVKTMEKYIKGISRGYTTKIEMKGIGYNGKLLIDPEKTNYIILNVGKSHKIVSEMDASIVNLEIWKGNKIHLFGISLSGIRSIAGKIQKYRKPDVYKGKGIRYEGEKFNPKVVPTSK